MIFRSEGEERDDLLPLPPPDLANCRVFSAPWAVLEGLKGLAAGLGVCGAVDFAQLGDDGLPVFPGRKIQRIADQMNDAGLNRGLRKDGLEAIRMSSTPRAFSSFITLSQNLAPSLVSIQRPRMSFVPSAATPSAS